MDVRTDGLHTVTTHTAAPRRCIDRIIFSSIYGMYGVGCSPLLHGSCVMRLMKTTSRVVYFHLGFPQGVRLSFADVSGPSVRSIFKG
jgi:hypothetical protein